MPAGLEVFSASGARIFGTDTRTIRFMGVKVLSAAETGYIDVPVGAGKSLMWFSYTTGTANGSAFAAPGHANRLGYSFDFGSKGGTAVILYGER